MQKGRIVALVTVASVAMGAFGVPAWTASRDQAPANLPMLLRGGTLYLTSETRLAAAQAPSDQTGRNLYIIQFTGPVQEAYKSALTGLGAELGDYIPENAFMVRMDAGLVAKVNQLGFVKGTALYSPSMKLDPALSQQAANGPVKVRVSTFGSGSLTTSLTSRGLEQLAARTDVVYVEPVRGKQLFNDKAAGIMGARPAWGAGLDGKGQVVAITDTGLDTGKNDSSMHPDFQGQIKALFALGRPGDASDTLGHGTHVAGSVLGTGKASNGLYKGVAPGARLVFESVEDKDGGLGGIPEDLGKLFRQAYDNGARIHSNSWGVPATQGGTVYDAQAQSVDRFIWENPDYTILFAAGNDGDNNRDGQTDYSTVTTPGTAKNAITVGASQNDRPDRKMGDNIRGMASFSSRGPTADGRVKPDIVAPGTWIASTRSSLAKDEEFWAPHESNSRYGYMGGTSMATPLTAGATALIRQWYVEKAGVTPRASLLKATLINGAAAMDSGLSWKDTGWGRVDINNSLYGHAFKFVNEEKALKTGDSQSYAYTVKAGQPLKATLVWTDYPANPSANKTLVNDLDLVVNGPSGEVLGNRMLAAGADRTNNVENVAIAAPQDGTYTVTVKGYNVPQGPQRFALVVSGSLDGGSSQDRQAPVVSLSSPAGGTTVGGIAQVTADAQDNVGVSKVIFYADGSEIGTATAAPYAINWDTGKVKDGAHSLVANAYDATGNVGIAKAVRVNVSNAARAGAREVQFTGKANGTQRHYLDVQAGTPVTTQLGLTGWGDVTLTALDPAGKQVASGKDSLAFTAAVSGTYTLQVTTIAGYSDYALKVSYTPADGTGVVGRSGSLSANDQRSQSYSIAMSKAGSMSAILNFSDPRADLDLYLLDSSGKVIAQGISPNLDPETLSFPLKAGNYTLQVVADSGKSDYQLTVIRPD
jgi:subtilisin family serine protease